MNLATLRELSELQNTLAEMTKRADLLKKQVKSVGK